MNGLQRALQRIVADVNDLGLSLCLVGGLAVSVRTEPRFTRDIDLAVQVNDDQQAEELIGSLRNHGYDVLSIIEQKRTGRLATVRLRPPEEGSAGVVIDLLFASSGIELEVVTTSEPLETLFQLTVPVARIEHLLALKILARDDDRRPQDIADIRSLLSVASDSELEATRSALKLITQRVSNRGKDLLAEFDSLLRQHN